MLLGLGVQVLVLDRVLLSQLSRAQLEDTRAVRLGQKPGRQSRARRRENKHDPENPAEVTRILCDEACYDRAQDGAKEDHGHEDRQGCAA